MPRELPGFYFDAEKNRYFPSSSKKEGKSRSTALPRFPAATPPCPSDEAASPYRSSSSTPLPQAARRRSSSDVWQALQLSRLATCPRQRIATIQLRQPPPRATRYLPIPYRLDVMCQSDDDGPARGLSSVSGYPYPCLHWPDPHSVRCAPLTS